MAAAGSVNTMKLAHRIGIALASIVVALVAFAAYMGAFASVTVVEGRLGPYTFVYKDAQGASMSEVGSITTELDALLAAHGVSGRQPLDVFYPDGRAEIGFAVFNTSAATRNAVEQGARIREVSADLALTARFPWRNQLSFFFGLLKVDHALTAYRTAHHDAKTEAYVLNTGETLLYFQPIAPAQ